MPEQRKTIKKGPQTFIWDVSRTQVSKLCCGHLSLWGIPALFRIAPEDSCLTAETFCISRCWGADLGAELKPEPELRRPRTAPGPGPPRLPPARQGRVAHRRRSVVGGPHRARRPGGRCRSSGRRRSRRAAAAGGRSRGRAASPPSPGAARRRRPSAQASPWLPAASGGAP